jgi:hypothetical protein
MIGQSLSSNCSLERRNERIDKLSLKQKKDVDWLNRNLSSSRMAENDVR